ncbi:MAG: ATP-binding protein [Bacteroidota bacterium]
MIKMQDEHFIFLGGFYLALGLLHFILYLYNTHKKANLLYSLGLVMVFINYIILDTNPLKNPTLLTIKLSALVNFLTNGILLYFAANYLFAIYLPFRRIAVTAFLWIYTLLFTVLCVTSADSFLFEIFATVLRFTCYAAASSICVAGFIRNWQNFYLIGSATLILLITEAFVAVDIFGLWDTHGGIRLWLILSGYSIPFIAYSSYLSKDLALTSKKLYEQERITRKILEGQNEALEQKVKERTRQICAQKEELEAQAEKIKEIDKIKSRFFANISHEFRTPLTLILNPLEKRIQSTQDSSDKRELIIMHRNGSKLLALVNQLLELSRLEDGRLKLETRNYSLSSILTPAVLQFSSLATLRNIDFVYDAPKEPVMACVDAAKMNDIVTNLLSNAFKFTPDGGVISLTLSKQNENPPFKREYAQITVSDTGIGISPEHHDKIFERFYQVDNSTTRQYEGSGIGLALCKDLLQLHEGTIEVISSLGQGSTFKIKLPLTANQRSFEHIEAKIVSNEQPPCASDIDKRENGKLIDENGRLKILVVEDNNDMRYYLSQELRKTYSVMESSDGHSGLSAAFREVPDLILSDIMMPKLDGVALCRKLKSDERTSHIPIIMLTARTALDSKIESYEIGADDYISKPFSLKELLARISNLIENRKKLQKKFSQNLSLRPIDIKMLSVEERFLEKVMRIIEEHMEDSIFSVDDLAKESAMSTIQLYRKLKALTGNTPNELIRNVRLERAKCILRQRGANVAEVAYLVGFSNLSYFAKCFKDKFGITPSKCLKT